MVRIPVIDRPQVDDRPQVNDQLHTFFLPLLLSFSVSRLVAWLVGVAAAGFRGFSFFCSSSFALSFLPSLSFSFFPFLFSFLVGGLVGCGLCFVLLVGFRLFGAFVLVLFLPSSHS